MNSNQYWGRARWRWKWEIPKCSFLCFRNFFLFEVWRDLIFHLSKMLFSERSWNFQKNTASKQVFFRSELPKVPLFTDRFVGSNLRNQLKKKKHWEFCWNFLGNFGQKICFLSLLFFISWEISSENSFSVSVLFLRILKLPTLSDEFSWKVDRSTWKTDTAL